MMEQFLNESGSNDDKDNSINSEELLDQIELKIKKQLQQETTKIEKPQQSKRVIDHNIENVEYLQIKEQGMVKKLLEIREEYRGLQNELISIQDQLVESIQLLIAKMQKKSKIILQEQEQQIRNQLQSIQQQKQLYSSFRNDSPQRIVISDFESMKQKLQSLCIQIQNWDDNQNMQFNSISNKKPLPTYTSETKSPLNDLNRYFMNNEMKQIRNDQQSDQKQKYPQQQQQELDQFIQALRPLTDNKKLTNQYQGQLQFQSTVFQSSTKKSKYQETASKSPLKDLDRYLQLQKSSDKKPELDLNQFISTLRGRNYASKSSQNTIDKLWKSPTKNSTQSQYQIFKLSIDQALNKQNGQFQKYRI